MNQEFSLNYSNNIYIYDDSFNSFLKLINYLLKFKIVPYDIKSNSRYEPNLIDNKISPTLNNEVVNIPSKIKSIIWYAFLSEKNNIEINIYKFIKYYFKYKDNVIYYRNIDCINEVMNVSNYVRHEAHKLKGFLRFKKMDRFYYAEISPTNNVISILSNHFKLRLSNEYWIIKDKKRKIYAVYDLNKIKYIKEDNIIKLNLSKTNDNYEMLWKTFFNTISIKERKNLKVQMNFMPKKYWNDILEMEDKI